MTERRRIEIGFGGGQVAAVAASAAQLDALCKALEAGDGWYHLDTDDGTMVLDLGKVVFVQSANNAPAVGFSG